MSTGPLAGSRAGCARDQAEPSVTGGLSGASLERRGVATWQRQQTRDSTQDWL